MSASAARPPGASGIPQQQQQPSPAAPHGAAVPSPAAAAPAKRHARVSYFIASHVNPEQILRLVRACRSGSPESHVLLHHDYNVSDLDPAAVARIGNVDLLRAEGAVGWGAFSMCVMVLRCMRWLLANRDFDWVVYLSGQDYPVKPLAQSERELTDSAYDGYLWTQPIEDVEWEVGAMRYLYQYYDVPRFPGWRRARGRLKSVGARRVARGGLPRVWPAPVDEPFRVGFRPLGGGPFRGGFRCYKGSSWWTLSRRSVEHMVRFADANPKLARYYRRILFAPNESYFQTILRNDPALNLVTYDHLRYIRWTRPETGHPDVLTSDDVDVMLASNKTFARKIDARKDPRVLDILDERLGIPRR